MTKMSSPRFIDPIKINILMIAVILLTSYGIFWTSYKLHIPEIMGTNDYIAYKEMNAKPLDLTSAGAPFVYRQFNAVCINFIYKSGLFWNTKTTISEFGKANYDPKIYFSASLFSYLGLLATMFMVSKIVQFYTSQRHVIIALIGAITVLLSVQVSAYWVSGLIDSWTAFFLALLFYQYKRRHYYTMSATLLVAVTQKEAIPITVCAFLLPDLAYQIHQRQGDKLKRTFRLFLFSSAIFLCYFVIRKYILYVPGYDEQISPGAALEKLTLSRIAFHVADYFRSQNLVVLLLLVTGLRFRNRSTNFLTLFRGTCLFEALSVSLALLVLCIIGDMTVGHICAFAVPLLATAIALMVQPYMEVESSARTASAT